MDSGNRSPVRSGPRATARIGGLAVVAALALALTPSVASAEPGPSESQIATAEARAHELQERIGALSGELAAARDAVERARAGALIALDEYQATQAAYAAAQQQADAAAAAAAQAAADLEVARTQVVDFARRSYMQGSTYPGAAALITAGDPGELVQRAALLEAAGSHRSDVLDDVTVVEAQAAEAATLARNAMDVAADLQQQAATTLEAAQAAELDARRQAAALDTQQAVLETELAGAQAELQQLVGERAAADRAAAVTQPAPAPPIRTVPAPSGNTRPAGAGDASAAQRAIDAAMAYRGIRYAWGGGGTDGPGWGWGIDDGVWGFDCSGLTQYAYAQAGVPIPRNSRWQYSSLPKVDRNDLRPGDLVFWATDTADPDTIHHVAIWLGGDEILEAPQSGSLVKVSDMRWRGYIGAGRPTA